MNDKTCGQFQEAAIGCDLDLAGRDRLLAALIHVQDCDHCQKSLDGFDQIRQVLPDDGEAVPAGGWDAFERRMQQGIALPPQGRSLRRLYALAAMLMICVGMGAVIYSVNGQPAQSVAKATDIPGAQGAEGATMGLLTREDVRSPVAAFAEVSQVFDGKAQWVMVSSNGSDMGIGGSVLAGGERPLVARVLVLSGGRTVSSADIVIVAGQTARTRLALPQGRSVEYLLATQTGQSRHLSLWAELSSGRQSLASFSTELDLVGSQMVSAGQVTTVYGSYELRVALFQWRKSGSEL